MRYSEIEKASLALMMIVRKLRPYFLSYQVIVCTNFFLKQVMSKPDVSARMVKWAVDLGEYDIDYESRSAIKAQALADFIQESTKPVEVKEWIIHVDGTSMINGSEVGIVVTNPEGDELEFAKNFEFRASNYEVEYEVLIRRMKITLELGAWRVNIFSNSMLVTQQTQGNFEVKKDRLGK